MARSAKNTIRIDEVIEVSRPEIRLAVTPPRITHPLIGMPGNEIRECGSIPIRGKISPETHLIDDVTRKKRSELLRSPHKVHVARDYHGRIPLQIEPTARILSIPHESHYLIDLKLAPRII